MKFLSWLGILALLLTVASASPTLPEVVGLFSDYARWKQNYGMHYASTSEDLFRFMVFAKNVRVINQHNLVEQDYKLGVNQFTALTQR